MTFALRRIVPSIGGAGADCFCFVTVRAASLILQFLGIVVLARTLEPAGYGQISMVLACVGMVAIPLQFGMPTLIVREVAVARAANCPGVIRGLTACSLQVFASVGVATLITMAIIWWVPFLPLRDESRAFWVLGVVLVPLTMLLTLTSAFARGMGVGLASQVPNQLIRPGLSIVGVIVVATAVTAIDRRPVWSLSMVVLATGLAAAAGVAVGLRQWRLVGGEPCVDEWGRWVRAAIPMALTSTLYTALLNVDVAILGLLRPEADVGCYRVALQCASLIVMMLMAVNTVVAPRYAELHAVGDRRGLRALWSMSAWVGGAWAIIVYGLFLVIGQAGIRTLFGDGYDHAMMPLVVLGAGEVVNACFGPVGMLLSMAGHEGDTLRGVAIAVVVKIVLCAVLIPLVGTVGAAIAAAAGTILWNLLLWMRVRARIDMRSVARGDTDAVTADVGGGLAA